MPYTPLSPITLADALNDTDPLWIEENEMNQPYLDNIFKNAQDCTGEELPDNWEARGLRHIAGTCTRCHQSTQEARTATIAREATRDTGARKQRPQTAINELIEMAVKKYGRG